jgi:hypothetical protein
MVDKSGQLHLLMPEMGSAVAGRNQGDLGTEDHQQAAAMKSVSVNIVEQLVAREGHQLCGIGYLTIAHRQC